MWSSCTQVKMDFFATFAAMTCIGFPVPVAVALALSTSPSNPRITRVRGRGKGFRDPFNHPSLEGDEELFYSQFRFYPADIRRLAAALKLPLVVRDPVHGHCRSREVALCFLLYRWVRML